MDHQCAHPGPPRELRDGARALWTDGDLRAGRRHFDAAYRAAQAAGDGAAMAQAAIGFAGLWVHEHRDVAGAVLAESRLRDALALAEPGSATALRLRGRLAAEADYRDGGAARTLAVLDQARRAGDPVAVAEAANLAHHCLLGPGHAERRAELDRELVEAALRTGRRGDLMLGLLRRTAGLFLAGDPHAERRLAELRAELARRDHRAVAFVVRAIETMLDLRAGRFDDAVAAAERCRQLGLAIGDANALGWHGAHLAAVQWFRGQPLAQLRPMLEDLSCSPTLGAADEAHLAALAVARAQAGDHRRAAAAVARLRGTALARLPRSSSWLITMYGVVEAAALLGDAATAADAYRLLAPFAGLPAMAGLGVVCFGSVEHTLGTAALTAGKPVLAARHLRAAVQANLALGHLPAAELSRARLAELEGLPAVRAPQHVWCRRQGPSWELGLGARTVLVAGSVGMAYLAELLANPGRELAAVDLAAGPAPAAPEPASVQPVLDERAKRAYRRRLDELQADIDAHEDAGDAARAERARAERAWVVGELTAAAGLAGRTRQFAGNPERARIAVGKAIRRALDRVAGADPVIGAELRQTVRTGTRCAYLPR